MPDPQTLPPAIDKAADELEWALRRAATPKTAEPEIAADDGGASALAEEDAKVQKP